MSIDIIEKKLDVISNNMEKKFEKMEIITEKMNSILVDQVRILEKIANMEKFNEAYISRVDRELQLMLNTIDKVEKKADDGYRVYIGIITVIGILTVAIPLIQFILQNWK